MTRMQRKACLSLAGLSYGRADWCRQFGRKMVRLAERKDWQLLNLTPRQLLTLARVVSRFRRQIANPNLQFWSQRTLVESAALAPAETLEEVGAQ